MSDNPLYRFFFKLRLYESSGEAFQRLINSLMICAFSDFEAVQPHGSQGDGGNDGYIPSKGRYLQIYGPKASSNWKPVVAAKKAKDDFAKLRQRYPGCKWYSFVINDRYEGTPAPVTDAMNAISSQFSIEANCLNSYHLENIFKQLSEDDKSAIVGAHPVGPIIDELDSSKLGDIIRHLADQRSSLPQLDLAAPDFDEKIRLNRLAPIIADMMKYASYQISEVDSLLDTDPGLAQDVAREINELYRRSILEIPEREPEAPSIRYVWLQQHLVPPGAHKHPHSSKAYSQAAQVLLAKYFETCDVYKHPNGASS